MTFRVKLTAFYRETQVNALAKSGITQRQIALLRQLLSTTGLQPSEVVERVGKPCTVRMVHYYRNKIKREREKKEKPAPLPDTLTALKLEVVNSYLMDALVRLSENERSITGNEPKKVQLRIACIEAIIKIRNSIEASREMGAGTIILGETHPRVAEFTLAMIPK